MIFRIRSRDQKFLDEQQWHRRFAILPVVTTDNYCVWLMYVDCRLVIEGPTTWAGGPDFRYEYRVRDSD